MPTIFPEEHSSQTGTVLAQLDPMGPFGEAEINYFVTNTSEYWMGSPDPEPIRSAEPLPDRTTRGFWMSRGLSTLFSYM